jgi:hypothetical protein
MSIVTDQASGERFSGVIKIEEEKIRSHVDGVVRASVEETLNGLLEAEADELCGAKRYERSVERLDTRAGHYRRKLHTKAGQVELKVPRLRSLPFETQIIERYRRRESSAQTPSSWVAPVLRNARCDPPTCHPCQHRASHCPSAFLPSAKLAFPTADLLGIGRA